MRRCADKTRQTDPGLERREHDLVQRDHDRAAERDAQRVMDGTARRRASTQREQDELDRDGAELGAREIGGGRGAARKGEKERGQRAPDPDDRLHESFFCSCLFTCAAGAWHGERMWQCVRRRLRSPIRPRHRKSGCAARRPARGAEMDVGQHGDARLVQQALAELLRVRRADQRGRPRSRSATHRTRRPATRSERPAPGSAGRRSGRAARGSVWRIVSAASCGPLIASTAAHWLICDAHESVLVIQRVNTGASARLAVKPMRQPVIAQVFDAPSEMIVRSCMPGSCAIETNSPSYTRRE